MTTSPRRSLRLSSRPTLTEAEFEQLPPSIQRKYFSELERLRIAESAIQPPAPRSRPKPQRSISLQDRPVWNAQRTKSIRRNGSTRNRLANAPWTRDDYQDSHAEAGWFISLPEKVRRQHFSQEERVLLESQSKPITSQDLAESTKDDHRVSIVRSARSLPGTPSSGATAVDFAFPCAEQKESQSDLDEPATDADIMSSQENRLSRSRRSSFRNLSIVPPPLPSLPFQRNSTSSTPSGPTTPTFRPHTAWSRTQSSNGHFPTPFSSRRPSFTGRRTSASGGSPVVDPAAKYYQDPDARKTLRDYLSCPQKFDEAIEFGFPSQEKETLLDESPLPQNHNRNSSRDLHAFLRNDRVSFLDSEVNLESDSSNDESSSETDSPTTPTEGDELFQDEDHVRSVFASLDSAALPTLNWRPPKPDPVQNLTRTREMTLRMTLTRPDLRADDDALYGWQTQAKTHDPLALEALPPITADHSGAQGAFAVSGKGQPGFVKKFMSKVKSTKR